MDQTSRLLLLLRAASTWGIVAANALPLIGVLSFGWMSLEILLLYFIELCFFGLLGLAKYALANRYSEEPDSTALILVVLFGGFFYALAMLWLGVAIVETCQPEESYDYDSAKQYAVAAATLEGIVYVALGLVVSQIVAFWASFLRHRTYLYVSAEDELKRIGLFILLICLAAQALLFIVSEIGFHDAGVMAVLLVLVKTGVELWAHQRALQRATENRATAARPTRDRIADPEA